MPATITIDLPRRALGSDLSEALAAHGLDAELVDDGARCSLHVRFATDEHERLLAGAVHAIEVFLGDRMLPLVVQPADGGAVVRPVSD